tara:strand:+ start:200 stop:1954 length:1755 start_codon:yes stop_codon:yes gene_type:complete
MIKQISKLSLSFCLIFSFVLPQESIFWEVSDPIVNSEFIEAYINQLIKSDNYEDNTIQASNSIIVQVDLVQDEIELKKLKAKNYQMGEYQSFMMSQVDLMDTSFTNMIVSREYKWKDVSSRDLSELEMFSTVDNIFQERSFKDARDAFWWSNAQLDVSSSLQAFIRQKSSSLAFRLESGFSDLGLYRHLSQNLILGLTNDIASAYLIVPPVTVDRINKAIGHPLEGNFGFGFKFDTHTLGGQVNYMDVDMQEIDVRDTYSYKHMVVPASSGLLYWSNTFLVKRKVFSDYGASIEERKTSKGKAQKTLTKVRDWKTKSGASYNAKFITVKEGVVTLLVMKDLKAHKLAEKGRNWATKSGSIVKATLDQQGSTEIIILRKKDKKPMRIKLSELSEEDILFLDRLQWDGEKTKTISIDQLSDPDQKLVQTANSEIRVRKGKGREIKVKEPWASMRIKGGLSFIQFIHGNINRYDTSVSEDDKFEITDRINGSEAIGFFVKVEGVTDDKKSKAFLQVNASSSGFSALGLGLEHNIYKTFNLGVDCSLYPKGSQIEFVESRTNENKKWTWYPGGDGGSLIIAPYVSVFF